MKSIYCILTFVTILSSSAAFAELSVREKALCKTVISQSFRMRLHVIKQNPEREQHPFYIALSNKKDKEKQLLGLFQKTKKGDNLRLLTAQALAYLGNDEGTADLKEATFPGKRIAPYMTNSGFEISESAICLLFLNFDFPDAFKFSRAPNPLYSELDKLLEK